MLADGRAQSAAAARAQLDIADRRLLAKRLPIVAQPPPSALSADVQVQAARALVLADLAESDVIADQLRAQYSGIPVLPSVLATPGPDIVDPSVVADRTITILPLGPSDEPAPRTATPPGLAPPRSRSSTPAPAPAPPGRAPAPAPPRPGPPPGLLPDVPVLPRLPLLGG